MRDERAGPADLPPAVAERAALVAALFVEWVNIKKVGRGGPPAEKTAEETESPSRKEDP